MVETSRGHSLPPCGTKVFFNPKDRETAHEFSGYLGEKEVRLFTHSRSQGRLWGAEPFRAGAASSVDDGRPDSEAEAGGMCSSSIRPTRGGERLQSR